MTARYDWTINQGETSELTVKRANSGGTYDSTTVFLNNFRMQAKDKYGGTSYLSVSGDGTAAPFTKDPVPLSNDEGNSTVLIALSAAQTAAIPAGKYVYDIENHDGAGTVARILEGTLYVKPEVTTDG